MKILVLYSLDDHLRRKTINDHLFCFKDYVRDADFHYCNIFTKIPFYLQLVNYDAVILHYTLLSLRWSPEVWSLLCNGLSPLKNWDAIKIAMPQDEYAETDSLRSLFKSCGIDTVYTCAYPVDYQTLYPQEQTGLKNYFTTLTGFVDENTLHLINTLSKEIPFRDIDIGYRARDVPFWLGHFGRYKGEIAKVFNRWKNKSTLRMDISTDPKEVFLGDDWIRFLLRCRTMLGCLGGASMIDADGSIRKNVDAYIERHPEATFDEVKEKFFADKDNTLQLFALSPRHFECAMARTCQILLEGDYQGIFEPGIHYIELKKDFSNVEEVLHKVEDHALCDKIANQAYEKVVLSGDYTYAKFANDVVSHIKEQRQTKTESLFNHIMFSIATVCLSLRKYNFPLHFFLFRITRFRKIKFPRILKAIGFAQ